jgi:peptidoglycan/LPS O-acetylase OafA/YrhL
LLIAGVQGRCDLLKGFVKSITLYPFPSWIDGVYWTLGIEMVFYFAVLCLIIIGAIRHVRLFAYALGATSAVYWIFGSTIWPEFIRAHLWYRPLELSLIPYGIYFALGMLGYSMFRNGASARDWFICFVLICAASIELYFKAEHNNLTFHSTLVNGLEKLDPS